MGSCAWHRARGEDTKTTPSLARQGPRDVNDLRMCSKCPGRGREEAEGPCARAGGGRARADTADTVPRPPAGLGLLPQSPRSPPPEPSLQSQFLLTCTPVSAFSLAFPHLPTPIQPTRCCQTPRPQGLLSTPLLCLPVTPPPGPRLSLPP